MPAPPPFSPPPPPHRPTTVFTTAPIAASQPSSTVVPTDALNALTAAIYGLQHQVGDLSHRVAVVESWQPMSTSPLLPYGLPGYGGIPQLPASAPMISELITTQPAAPAVVATTAPPPLPSLPLSITQISFPHSPSPVPSFSSIMNAPTHPCQPPCTAPTAAALTPRATGCHRAAVPQTLPLNF